MSGKDDPDPVAADAMIRTVLGQVDGPDLDVRTITTIELVVTRRLLGDAALSDAGWAEYFAEVGSTYDEFRALNSEVCT